MFKASLTYKNLVSYTIAMVFGFSSISPALAQTVTQTEKARAADDAGILKNAGYDVRIDYKNKTTYVYEKKSQIPVMEIPFSDDQELRKYDPKNWDRRLMTDLGKVWDAQKGSFKHSVKNLAPESLMFFTAMGVVMAGQLIFNYSQNPVAMEQHVSHSFSPVGIIGFQLFMYSQGAASNVLAMYMKNPKYHAFIPYLGMTVGATVQGLASQLMSDPNVKACGKAMMGYKPTQSDFQSGVDKDPCSKAYEYLVLHKKIWEMAPGITSMLISSALAAGLQKGVVMAAKSAKARDIVRWTGTGLSMLGGGQMKLVFLVGKGLQLTAFTAIDSMIVGTVTSTWNNLINGFDLYRISGNLEESINEMKKRKWTGDDKELQENLKDFKESLASWRTANLSKSYEANQNWQSALFQMTQGYKAAENFYGDFVTQVRDYRFGDKPADITLKAPLFGVRADGVKNGDDTFHTDPNFIQQRQAYTVQDVAASSSMLLSSPEFKKMSADHQKKFTAIVNGLGNSDLSKVAAVLNSINAELRTLAYTKNYGSAEIFQKFLYQVRDSLGNPYPKMDTGAAWASTYITSPSTFEKVKDTSFYRRVGSFSTPQISDNLIMQMVCGPDIEKGESIVRTSTGFSSVFLAPKIGNSKDKFKECESNYSNNVSLPYGWPVQSFDGKYNGWVEYLLAQARPSVIGGADQADTFSKWWKEKTYQQVKASFDQFAVKYDDIIVKLIEGIYQPGKAALNAGPAYNGTMNSIFQEERAYLSILNDLMTPAAAYKMDFENNMKVAPTHPLLKEVEAEFTAMNRLLKQIKVVNRDGRQRIESTLENSQLEEQEKRIQAALNKVAKTFGADNSTKKEEPAAADPFAALNELDGSQPQTATPVIAQKYKLTKAQNNLVVGILEALQGLAMEVKMYGSIANAVSWDKINRLAEVDEETQKFNNLVQKQMAEMRSIMNPSKH